MTLALASPVKHRFGLELFGPGGRALPELPLTRADFDRAAEAVFFDALRRGLVAGYAPDTGRAVIVPHFNRPDRPQAESFTVTVPTAAGEHALTFPASFFHGLAHRTGARLAVEGVLPPEVTLGYRLCARPEAAPPRRAGLSFEMEPEVAVGITAGSRRALGPAEAWDTPAPDDFPVVLPRVVLQEAVAEACRQPEREVGGVLLGHLRRDPDGGELFLEVTCFVPAEETEATGVSVTFTHATWQRVREVLAWRGQGELIVGWVHSHPFRFCGECPNPPKPECISKVLFYSGDDEFLMETTFPRPFMVGLLTAVEPRLESALGHLPVRLFGWRGGKVAARGFEVV